MKFEKLFQPIQIGKLTVSNRIVAAPLNMDYATDDGFVTDSEVGFYEAQAKGGAGLIIVGAASVDHPQGNNSPRAKGISDDKYIPGLKRIADVIKAQGVVAGLQLCHSGRQAPKYCTSSPVSASPVPPGVRMIEKDYYIPPREITVEEIRRLVRAFADAARRLKEAGFEMMELHGGHGYLLSSFISSYLNLRTDEYGGSLENRLRFPVEVVKACRKEVGPEFVMSFRMNATDLRGEQGTTLATAKKIAHMLVEAGVNIINSSAGLRESTDWIRDYTGVVPRGAWTYFAEGIKDAVGDTPVMTINRINSPAVAERILEETKIDLIAMGRALIADPELPNKAREGRIYDIRSCIGCNEGCLGTKWLKTTHTTCLVNPAVGKERELSIEPARKPKNVLVVGGGPAGMEAARVAALRKHEVTLCEMTNSLGGQMKLITPLASAREFGAYIEYLSYQIAKLGVKIELGREVTPQYIKKAGPDVLIVAIGPEETVPAIPGIKETKLYKTSPARLLANGLLSYDWGRIGEHIIVLCPRSCCAVGSWIGCLTMETLAKNGKKATMITPQDDIVTTMGWPFKHFFMQRLEKLDVEILTNIRVKQVDATSVVIEDGVKQQRIFADSLLMLTRKARKDLAKSADGVVPEIYEIGDCDKVGNALKAVADGYAAALRI